MSKTGKNDLSRRDFIKATTAIIGGVVGLGLGLPAIAYLVSPSLRKNEENGWIDLGALADCPLNLPKLFEFTRTKINGWERTAMSYGVFVVRQDEKNVRVFSNICTHLGCHISWHPNIKNYVSPCHDGHFDIVGKVVSGPPPRPLDEFTTKIEGGNLFIQLPPFRRTS